jgi:uncharacterized protein YjiS (DUF1127 family)
MRTGLERTMNSTSNAIASLPAVLSRTRAQRRRWAATLALCFAQIGERRLLRQLSDDQLKDIGLSRADVERECRRWPWDGRAWD